MEEIKALVDLLSKAKISRLELFSSEDFSEKPNKTSQMFRLISQNEKLSKDDLSKMIYANNVSEVGFNKLYNRFQEKLINTLFFVDTKSPVFSERAKAYINCAKRINAIRILEDKGLFALVNLLAERTLIYSMKYEFTELNISLTRILCRQFSTTTPRIKKLLKYQLILENNIDLFNRESQLEKSTYLIGYEQNFPQNKSPFKHNKNEFYIRIKELIDQKNEEVTIEIISHLSKLAFFYYQKTNQLILGKHYNQSLLKKILSKKFISAITLEGILLNQLQLTLVTKDIDEAKLLEKKYFKEVNKGHFNWYAIYFYYILNFIHSKYYNEGIEYLNMVTSNSTFKKQPSIISEIFLVLEAYSQFLIRIKKAQSFYLNIDFKITKFINQVPIYSKDKQGINIPIILVQIFFYLADKKYSKIIDRMESLNLYSYRHLKKDENFRSQCFIKMISEMVRADFRKQGTLFRTEKLLIKLKAVPIDTFPATAETEIIPYEDLWEMVIERLD